MSWEQFDIIVLASLTSVSCALVGVFLVLRRVALMSDAISHAILFGIVLAFFATKNLSSPWLFIGATLTGVLTVVLTELIIHTQKLKKDAAIGLVFPLLFSIAVILINQYAGNIHLDTDAVLLGEIAFAPFNRFIFNGMDWGPMGLWTSGGIFLLNVLFINTFYKELKLTTFDAGLAAALGFSPLVINYMLMTMVSVTAVASFEHVGSILVVTLMIAPAAAAYLLTDRLSRMLIISALFGIISAIGGYGLAYLLDANIAGSMATFSGLLFFMVLIFAPDRGLIALRAVKKWEKWKFASETLAVHLFQAEHTHEQAAEKIVSHMNDHMLWDDVYTTEAIAQAIQDGLIIKEGNMLSLTPLGREKVKNIISKE